MQGQKYGLWLIKLWKYYLFAVRSSWLLVEDGEEAMP